MASKKSLALLGLIVAAMDNDAAPFHMATEKELTELLKEGLVETNADIRDGDKIATRATDPGIAAIRPEHNEGNTNLNDQTSAAAAAAAPVAAAAAAGILTGVGFVPPANTSSRGRGRTLYNFDTLEMGGFIFVPNTEKKPDAAKSLASTVSGATAKFAIPVLDENGQPKTKTVKVPVYQLDEDGKRAKDAEGKLIKTGEKEETRPVVTETRKFAVLSVEGGKAYGEFTAPADGAVIYRTA